MKPPSRGWSLGVPINGFQKSVMSLKRINENDTLRNRNRTKVKIKLSTAMVMEMVTELTVVVLLVMFVVSAFTYRSDDCRFVSSCRKRGINVT